MKEKTKITIKFFIILAASLVIGYLIGLLCGHLNISGLQVQEQTLNTLAYAVTIVFWAMNLVLGSCSVVLYRINKKRWTHGQAGDEVLDRLEYTLNFPVLLSNIALVLNLFLVAVVIFLVEKSTLDGGTARLVALLGFAAMALGYIWILILQSRIVALCKEMNPEKKGYLLDMKFQKVWVDSCDEAQKLMVYKAAFASFKAGNIVCMLCWLISFLGIFLLDCGLLPVILVTVIYMTLILAYTLSAMKQERPSE